MTDKAGEAEKKVQAYAGQLKSMEQTAKQVHDTLLRLVMLTYEELAGRDGWSVGSPPFYQERKSRVGTITFLNPVTVEGRTFTKFRIDEQHHVTRKNTYPTWVAFLSLYDEQAHPYVINATREELIRETRMNRGVRFELPIDEFTRLTIAVAESLADYVQRKASEIQPDVEAHKAAAADFASAKRRIILTLSG